MTTLFWMFATMGMLFLGAALGYEAGYRRREWERKTAERKLGAEIVTDDRGQIHVVPLHGRN